MSPANPKDIAPIPKGAMIVSTSGEYSSYCVNGVYMALQDFDPADLHRQWLAQRAPAPTRGPGFYSFLEARGLIKDLTYFEMWQDDYGRDELTNKEQVT